MPVISDLDYCRILNTMNLAVICLLQDWGFFFLTVSFYFDYGKNKENSILTVKSDAKALVLLDYGDRYLPVCQD